jgi:hypothetical protein
LNNIRKHNSDIRYAYIHRILKEEGRVEFVANSDSNYCIPFENRIDYTNNWQLDIADLYRGTFAEAILE